VSLAIDLVLSVAAVVVLLRSILEIAMINRLDRMLDRGDSVDELIAEVYRTRATRLGRLFWI
jgi:hypothetical protein